MAGERLNVVHRDGSTATIPAASADAALKAGWHLETPEEHAQRTGGGPLRAAAEGAARGALDAAALPARVALGAADLVTGGEFTPTVTGAIDKATGGTGKGISASELLSGGKALESAAVIGGEAARGLGLTEQTGEATGRQYTETARATAEANPIASTLGYIGGGLAAFGAGGVNAALSNLGKGAQAALAARGAGTVASRAGGLAASGALEGGLQGAAQANEDAFIENKPLTAQRVLATVGLNALAGGGLGGGLGAALGKFESRAAAKAALGATKSAEERALEAAGSAMLGGEAPAPGLGKAMRELYEGAAAGASGVDRESIAKYGAHRVLAGDEAATSAWRELAERPQLVENAARDITEGVDALRRESQAVMDEVVDAGLKREVVAKNLAAVDREAARVGAQEQAATLKQTMGALQDVETFGDNRWAKGALKFVDDSLDGVMSGALGAEDAYMALDAAKRQLQRLKVRGEEGIRGATFDMNKKGALQEFTRVVDEAAEAARVHLEDASLWGKQGQAQAATNEAWSRLLTSKRTADKALLTSYVDDYGRPVFEADPAKIQSFAEGLGTARASKVEALVKDNLEATRNLIDTIAANYDVGAKHASALSAARAAQERVATTLADTSAKTRRVNQLTAMLEAEKDGVAGLMGSGTVTGGILGGWLGAAGGAASNVVTRPMATAMQAARLNALAGNTVRRTAQALDRFFGHLPSSEKLAKAAGAVGRTLSAAGRRAVVAGATGGQPSVAEAPKHRERVAELAANPVALAEQVDKFVGGAASRLPMTHMALAAVPMRAIQFLASKLPPSPPQHALNGAYAAPIAPSDQARFNEYVQGATEPLSVLDSLEDGTLTIARVEAMEAVYPDMYAELRKTVFDYVTAAAEAEQPMQYAKRQQLDVLFGGKGAIEPSMSPTFMRTVEQAAMMAKRAPHPGGGGGKRRSTAPSIAESMGAKTGLSRLDR